MSGGSYSYVYCRVEEECVNRMFDSQLNEMMKVYLVENINNIHDEFVREACARLDREIWNLIGFSTKFIFMESCLEQITNYIVKLERGNLGLKEYKKHQERANERRYRSGEESWHRGSVVAKKK